MSIIKEKIEVKEVPTVYEILNSVRALNYFLNSMLYIFARRSQINDEAGEDKEFISNPVYNEISVAIKSRNKVKIRKLYPFINKEAHIIGIFVPSVQVIINMFDFLDIYLENTKKLIYETGNHTESDIINEFYNLVNGIKWLDIELIIDAHKFIEDRIVL